MSSGFLYQAPKDIYHLPWRLFGISGARRSLELMKARAAHRVEPNDGQSVHHYQTVHVRLRARLACRMRSPAPPLRSVHPSRIRYQHFMS